MINLSMTTQYFYLNTSYFNLVLKEIFDELNMESLQISFKM